MQIVPVNTMRTLLLSHIYYYGLLHARVLHPVMFEVKLLLSTTENTDDQI
jgi:hypothetical protein